ncbi:TetR/AcrR family transcriptional regulator [Lederbergia lenta]|uniref:TetR/AcrR family transcriptional regulator n=1 Tax=Lederbergia lenta TaxID=1467 RepID=UPI00203F4D04|nr:TetR/AcrR family transcriptional regulator [Lederbergia lenta]MCM3112722.1 TetR/AcrR family transcriptional regulator [Lederbergia lenta]
MNDRKRHVLLTAKQLFVKKGYSATSIQDILEESEISKGTFYNYFSSKSECIMAILQEAHDDASIRRRELLIGKDISDKKVFAEQISVRMQVNREHKLLPLFETIFHSGDHDLRAFVKKHHLAELFWLSNRLVDVYGDEVAPYSLDCAVMTVGILQQMLHVCAASSKEEIDIPKLIHFTIRRLDAIVLSMINTKDMMLDKYTFSDTPDNVQSQAQTKQQLLEMLADFYKRIENEAHPRDIQYLQFLIDELQEEQPKLFLIETIIRPLREDFSRTAHESEARELTSKLWNYVNLLEKQEGKK